MKPLDNFLLLYTTLTKVFLAEVRVDATLEQWEALTSREDVCEFLRNLKDTDEHGFQTCTVVSPAGFVYTADEFLTDMCPCTVAAENTFPPLTVEPSEAPIIPVSMMSYSEVREFSIYLENSGVYV